MATAAAICDNGGSRGRRFAAGFATIDAAEGGGGSSVDVLDVRLCVAAISPSFLYNPTVGIVQRTISRFLPPAEG